MVKKSAKIYTNIGIKNRSRENFFFTFLLTRRQFLFLPEYQRKYCTWNISNDFSSTTNVWILCWLRFSSFNKSPMWSHLWSKSAHIALLWIRSSLWIRTGSGFWKRCLFYAVNQVFFFKDPIFVLS